jgi:substrate import-associated zinc metallohydrolase lipoprotein
MKKIISLLSIAAIVAAFSSCRSEDDLTDSIFDTTVPVVDPSKATAPFDQWLYDNFVKPYNVEVQYQFNYPASDLSFQLAPADYNRSQLLAHMIRYLFYDVYTKFAGDEFMKLYGPRIFHFIGSTGYNATSGTEVLGTAAGGVKITLYNVNEMKPFSDNVQYNNDDITVLNERYFHTMHHEFSHILHQTKAYPVAFGQVTSSTYDPMTWQERDSVITHQLGYVTHYASSATYEDFVETLSCIITDTDHRWMNRIIDACCRGMRQGDREEVLTLVDSLGVRSLDVPERPWNHFKLLKQTHVFNENTNEYDVDTTYVPEFFRNTATVYNSKSGSNVAKYKYTTFKEFNSFREFLDWVPYTTDAAVNGINALLKKINIATEWYTDRWGLHAFELREEVRYRQDHINEWLKSGEVKVFDLNNTEK